MNALRRRRTYQDRPSASSEDSLVVHVGGVRLRSKISTGERESGCGWSCPSTAAEAAAAAQKQGQAAASNPSPSPPPLPGPMPGQFPSDSTATATLRKRPRSVNVHGPRPTFEDGEGEYPVSAPTSSTTPAPELSSGMHNRMHPPMDAHDTGTITGRDVFVEPFPRFSNTGALAAAAAARRDSREQRTSSVLAQRGSEPDMEGLRRDEQAASSDKHQHTLTDPVGAVGSPPPPPADDDLSAWRRCSSDVRHMTDAHRQARAGTCPWCGAEGLTAEAVRVPSAEASGAGGVPGKCTVAETDDDGIFTLATCEAGCGRAFVMESKLDGADESDLDRVLSSTGRDNTRGKEVGAKIAAQHDIYEGLGAAAQHYCTHPCLEEWLAETEEIKPRHLGQTVEPEPESRKTPNPQERGLVGDGQTCHSRVANGKAATVAETVHQLAGEWPPAHPTAGSPPVLPVATGNRQFVFVPATTPGSTGSGLMHMTSFPALRTRATTQEWITPLPDAYASLPPDSYRSAVRTWPSVAEPEASDADEDDGGGKTPKRQPNWAKWSDNSSVQRWRHRVASYDQRRQMSQMLSESSSPSEYTCDRSSCSGGASGSSLSASTVGGGGGVSSSLRPQPYFGGALRTSSLCEDVVRREAAAYHEAAALNNPRAGSKIGEAARRRIPTWPAASSPGKRPLVGHGGSGRQDGENNIARVARSHDSGIPRGRDGHQVAADEGRRHSSSPDHRKAAAKEERNMGAAAGGVGSAANNNLKVLGAIRRGSQQVGRALTGLLAGQPSGNRTASAVVTTTVVDDAADGIDNARTTTVTSTATAVAMDVAPGRTQGRTATW